MDFSFFSLLLAIAIEIGPFVLFGSWMTFGVVVWGLDLPDSMEECDNDCRDGRKLLAEILTVFQAIPSAILGPLMSIVIKDREDEARDNQLIEKTTEWANGDAHSFPYLSI